MKRRERGEARQLTGWRTELTEKQRVVEEVRVSCGADHVMVGGRRRVPVGDRIEESVNLSREEVNLSARRTSGEIDVVVIKVGDDELRDG